MVLTVGETLAVARSARPLRLGGDLGLSIAGAEANVAIGLARLGHPVRWFGRVGEDELGALVARTLRAEGVDVRWVVHDDTRRTALMLTDRAPGGHTRVHYYREGSAGARISSAELTDAVFTGVGLLHFSGVTPALGVTAAQAVRHAITCCRRDGVKVSFDLNYRSRLWSRDRAARCLAPLARMSDIVFASEDELALVAAEGQERERAKALLTHGATEVVVTRGPRGASAYTAGGRIDCPARDAQVVDTTGAGDAFAAGYLSALLDGLPTEARLDRAVALGACAVASAGDWEGLPTRAELELANLEHGTTIR